MRAYPRLTASLALSLLREPVGFSFTLVFAPVLVLVLGLIFGNEPTPEFGGVGYITKTLPAFASLVLAIVGVMIMPQQQLQLRDSGVLIRLRVTPLRPSTWIAAQLTVNFVLGMVGMLLALALGVIAFGVDLPQRFGSVLAAGALGLIAFLALGYLLAAIYPSVGAAVGIGNVLMILLMMTSGAFVPLAVLPTGVQQVVRFSPIHYFVELTSGLWAGDAWGDHVDAILVLVGMTVVCGALGVWRFRWSPRR